MRTINTTIQSHQRGLLYKNSKLVQWLEPGKHTHFSIFSDYRVDLINLDEAFIKSTPELRKVLPESAGYEATIAAHELGILTVDGVATQCLNPGKYILWQERAVVDIVLYDTRQLIVDMPEDHVKLMPQHTVVEYSIAATQRGVLLVNKQPAVWLEPGKHYVFTRNRSLNLMYFNLIDKVYSLRMSPELASFVPKEAADILKVKSNEIALVYDDGVAVKCLDTGTYLVWTAIQDITTKIFSTEDVFSTIPQRDWEVITDEFMETHVILPYERGMVWVDGTFHGELEAGTYGIYTNNSDVEFIKVDMRERELQITGQEVMSKDKVTLRLNLILKYTIEDALKSVESSTSLNTALYSEVQLIARGIVAGMSIDELLEQRDEVSTTMNAQLQERAQEWGLSIKRVDIKDLILPGEMKTLLNRVIEAEKQAAANVIMRREETAAMRAQANTAKMMENNPALLRMRELEMMREIALNVGNITVVAGSEDVAKWAHGNKN